MMKITNIKCVYFSPTHTTKKVVNTIGETISNNLGLQKSSVDITPPENRQDPLFFQDGDLCILGMPVYAGRVPNVLLKYLDTISGNGAIAIPVVVYGNRDYDDALMELKDILEDSGMSIVSAGAFIGEHSFSYKLGKGRPDKDDIEIIKDFADQVSNKLQSTELISELKSPHIKGKSREERQYYQPKDGKKNSIDIRKVKPVTDDSCVHCGLCVKACPMGSINKEDESLVEGICIKCGACIKLCPTGSKSIKDEGYLFHKKDLEEKYERRAEPELFL